MPTYGYRCRECKHEFETFQKMSDEPLKVCPECGGELQKLLYASNVIFKGGGFYHTEYGKGKEIAKKDKELKEKATSTKESKTESA